MYIAPSLRSGNIGHELNDGGQWVRNKWNPRYIQALKNTDRGLPNAGGQKWLLRKKTQGRHSSGHAIDSNRNWTTPFQDIVVIFNTKCRDGSLTVGGTATGHTIKVNGSAQTTTYRSGSGTAYWTLRVPVLVDADDNITYSYDPATGNTTAVDDSQEIAVSTDVEVKNLLTRRIRFTLRKSDNSLVVSETVKIAILRFSGGVATEGPGDYVAPDNPQGGRWMIREMSQIVTTDSNGFLDIRYTGRSVVGTTIYIVVYRPNAVPTESFAWTDTIK